MAKPRVFISSTFFDLRHIRADLERFVIEIGYEPIRNEKGDIPYGAEENLEEYCYKEVKEVDILIGIIGNRYGSESKNPQHSITQLEIKTAFEEGKQVYLFIDKNVYTEYSTYLINKGSSTKYHYVDNIKIFEFIEEVMSMKAGIIISPFENVNEVTSYLKLQWAGLFRDLLRHKSESQQLKKLSSQIDNLSVISETLKTYIEKSLPEMLNNQKDAEEVIKSENVKISNRKITNYLINNGFVQNLMRFHNIKLSDIRDAFLTSISFEEFTSKIMSFSVHPDNFRNVFENAILEINAVRIELGLDPYPVKENYKTNFKFHHDGTITLN